MPIKLFCNLDRQTVFSGGTLSGNLVLVSDEEQNGEPVVCSPKLAVFRRPTNTAQGVFPTRRS